MIDLSESCSASPHVHVASADPGITWTKHTSVAVDAPPDTDSNPRPEARWSRHAARSGICGAVAPRVVALPGGNYRMYYTQILPQPGFPSGANDYENATTRILSAFSVDGLAWDPEPGVRLAPQTAMSGELRVVSSEVVPADDGTQLRMYYESCPGPQSIPNSICSAVSSDGGLEWTIEPGTRLQRSGHNFAAPRIVFLKDGRCRLYCTERGTGIISAVSDDNGLVFQWEPGVRLTQVGTFDSHVAFAPEILFVEDFGYVMYYAGYSQSTRARILRAVSDDGLTWRKESEPVLLPGPGGWDAAKCSEMCVIRLPQGEGTESRYCMLYEACDGTAPGQRGVWRIASATSNGCGPDGEAEFEQPADPV